MIVEVALAGRLHRVAVGEDADALVVAWGETRRHVRLHRLAGAEWWRLEADGQRWAVRIRPHQEGLRVTVGPARADLTVRRALPVPSRRAAAAASARAVEVHAPMPGLVVAVPVAPGQAVTAGQAV
ncbi:MAG: hypothetical protein QN203_08825, partial [Armatimonadota bacterium]|nr:hypothetical protein [Armatimonadota bacterium]